MRKVICLLALVMLALVVLPSAAMAAPASPAVMAKIVGKPASGTTTDGFLGVPTSAACCNSCYQALERCSDRCYDRFNIYSIYYECERGCDNGYYDCIYQQCFANEGECGRVSG